MGYDNWLKHWLSFISQAVVPPCINPSCSTNSKIKYQYYIYYKINERYWAVTRLSVNQSYMSINITRLKRQKLLLTFFFSSSSCLHPHLPLHRLPSSGLPHVFALSPPITHSSSASPNLSSHSRFPLRSCPQHHLLTFISSLHRCSCWLVWWAWLCVPRARRTTIPRSWRRSS